MPGCLKKFNRPARLLAHLRSHNNERPFKCTYEGCEKAYADKKHLNGHVLSAHDKDKVKFTCPTCSKGFATGQRLKRHALVHEGEERYKCRDYPPCTQSFRKHQTLQRHIMKDHLGEKPYKCTHQGCGEGYDTANALKSHTTRAHGELRFWCTECAAVEGDEAGTGLSKPMGFTTQWLLEQHIRQAHVNCVFCDVKFGGQYELEQHMEIYHSGLTVKDRKNVACEYPGCDKRFTKKSNMKTHYRAAHEGMRFVCGTVDTWETPGLEDWNWTEEGCGQDFTAKAALEQHILYVHLGKQRPYIDFGTFNPNATGNNVLDELSGVAEYERRDVVCQSVGCGARFIRYADLHNHVQAEHPEQAIVGGLLGVSEIPQPDWIVQQDASAAAVEDQTNFVGDNRQMMIQHNAQNDEGWTEEEASVMQLLDLDAAIDPELLAVA